MMNKEYAQATEEQLCEWFDAAHQEEYDRYEAEQWDREMRQLLWAEAGGYKAGLARPCY
jgi:hypothetical protein